MKVKKISLKNWSEFLTDNEMKATRGGYGTYGPYQLPEVTITCTSPNAYGGRCHACRCVYKEFHLPENNLHFYAYVTEAYFTGYQTDNCFSGRSC